MIHPHDILRVAEQLASNAKGSEAELRSAASRTYYSVFHLMGQDVGPSDYQKPPASHHAVRQALLSEPPGTCERYVALAKRYFDTLMHARVKSDYHLQEEIKRPEVQLWLRQAKEIFDAKP